MMFAENRGANCDNCNNRGVMKQCRKCQKAEGRQGWDPADGVQTRIYEFCSGPKMTRKLGREVIEGEAI